MCARPRRKCPRTIWTCRHFCGGKRKKPDLQNKTVTARFRCAVAASVEVPLPPFSSRRYHAYLSKPCGEKAGGRRRRMTLGARRPSHRPPAALVLGCYRNRSGLIPRVAPQRGATEKETVHESQPSHFRIEHCGAGNR